MPGRLLSPARSSPTCCRPSCSAPSGRARPSAVRALPSGSGSIAANIDLGVGGTATFTISAVVSPAATSTLSNTATIAAPSGVTDSFTSNNTATDTDTLNPEADLSITKTDGRTDAQPGDVLTYTIVATNAGPSAVFGAPVVDTLPGGLTAATWTCVASGGATCVAVG